MKPALLVIDIQQRFMNLSPEYKRSLEDAIDHINVAIQEFREKKLPIICIQHMNEKTGFTPGSEGFDSPSELKVISDDIHFQKTYSNGFIKTGLHDKLQKLGVDTLIVTGFCAEYCVLSTYRGAKDLDYTPIMLRGSLASDNQDHIRFTEEISDVISLGALKSFIENC